MMLKRLLLGLVGGVVLLTGQAFAAVDENYSVVLLTENYPPYNMAINGKNFAPDDNIDGIAADIVREMFKRAGIKYALSLRFPWDRIYKLALDKPGYGVFSTARTPAREALFKWVGPIGPDDWVVLAKNDSAISLSALDEVKQYKVGAYKGGAVGNFLIEQGLEPQLPLRDQENAKKLQDGKIDLWATGDPSGRYLAKLEGISGLKTVLRIHKGELFLALNREIPDEVVQKLQTALDKMRAEGYVDDIINSYQ
jgi:polar amino acid transport system substrate-binding protein